MPPDLFDVSIESLALGGDGIGHLPDGRVVFVPFSAPGDQVRVRLTESKKRFARGRIREILEPSPARRDPPCPYFGTCGGCQYQHIAYEEECRQKQQQIHDTLTRLGGVDAGRILDLIPCPERYGYRNRVTVQRKDNAIGFVSVRGNSVVDIGQCLLAEPRINEKLSDLRKAPRPGDRFSLRSEGVVGEGFFQVNRFMNQRLLDEVERQAPPSGRLLLEGYAGTGWLTRTLAPRFDQVITVEWDSRCVEKGKFCVP